MQGHKIKCTNGLELQFVTRPEDVTGTGVAMSKSANEMNLQEVTEQLQGFYNAKMNGKGVGTLSCEFYKGPHKDRWVKEEDLEAKASSVGLCVPTLTKKINDREISVTGVLVESDAHDRAFDKVTVVVHNGPVYYSMCGFGEKTTVREVKEACAEFGLLGIKLSLNGSELADDEELTLAKRSAQVLTATRVDVKENAKTNPFEAGRKRLQRAARNKGSNTFLYLKLAGSTFCVLTYYAAKHFLIDYPNLNRVIQAASIVVGFGLCYNAAYEKTDNKYKKYNELFLISSILACGGSVYADQPLLLSGGLGGVMCANFISCARSAWKG